MRLLAIAMSRHSWNHILCADDRAGRDGGNAAAGTARAAAGALNGERTEVVDLVTLLDLQSVVVAIRQRGGRGPDELATRRVLGQGLDGLEITRGALAQEDAHGLESSQYELV